MPGIEHDVLAARGDPGQRELPCGAALLGRELLDGLDEAEVGLERLLPEARRAAAVVVGGQVLQRPDRAGEEAAAERAVRHQPDAELAQRGEHRALDVAAEQAVLALHRGDRVHGDGPADRVGRRLGQPEVPHLAGGDELGHRADGLRHVDLRVDAVLVVEVDDVDAEPLQRGVAGGADVLRPAVHAAAPVGGALDAELRREHDLVAATGDRPPDELLVGEGAVHVGGVEQRHAEVERAVHDGDRLGLVAAVGGAVEVRHPHAAQALGADGEAADRADGQGHASSSGSASASSSASIAVRAPKTPGADATTMPYPGAAPRSPPTRAPASLAISRPAHMSHGDRPCS